MEASLKSTFQEHHDEIRRRSSLPSNPDALNPVSFRRVDDDGVDAPFVDPEQTFVVFSLSHAEFAPKPEDAGNPAICVYGIFETMVEAQAHAKTIVRTHPEVSILIDRTHKWIVATSTLERLGDASYVQAHTRTLLDRHATTKQQNDAEFQRIVESKEAGPVSTTPSSQRDDDETTTPTPRSSSAPEGPAPKRFKIDPACKVTEQRVVVASFVKDDAALPEFIFMVYGAFEDEAKANRYVRNVCGTHVTDFDIDVVQSAAWVFPQRMDGPNAQKEIYRSEELNRVMQTHKKNPQEVERFMKENEDKLKDWEMLPPAEAPAAASGLEVGGGE